MLGSACTLHHRRVLAIHCDIRSMEEVGAHALLSAVAASQILTDFISLFLATWFVYIKGNEDTRNYGRAKSDNVNGAGEVGGLQNELCRLLPPRARCAGVGNCLRFSCADQLNREPYLFAGGVKNDNGFCLR
jgi:hypothetical protein